MTSPVIQACLMMHVHDEIYHGLLHQSDLHIDYDTEMRPGVPFANNDIVWRNLIVWRCGQVLQKMIGGQVTTYEWREMTASITDWETRRPASFEPFFSRHEFNNETSRISQIWFQEPCHGMLYKMSSLRKC